MHTTITSILSVYRYKTDRKAFRAAQPNRKFHILSYQEYGHYDHYVNGEEIPVKKDMIFLETDLEVSFEVFNSQGGNNALLLHDLSG